MNLDGERRIGWILTMAGIVVAVILLSTAAGPIADGGVASADRVGTVDGFEDGNLGEYERGENAGSGDFAVQQAIVFDGTYALNGNTYSGGTTSECSASGLDRYPVEGDTFEYRVYADDGYGVPFLDFGRGFRVLTQVEPGEFEIYGNGTSSITSVNIPTGEWLRVVVEFGETTVDARLYDSSGSQLATVSHQNDVSTDYDGRICFGLSNNNGGSSTAYFDSLEITSTTTTHGQVTDADGSVIEDTTVAAVNTSTGNVSARTNATVAGEYALSLNSGEYDIRANKSGYANKTKTVDVPAGGKTVNFQLTEALGSFTFVRSDGTEITDRETRVELYEASGEEEAVREPRYWLDETDREPIATGSGSSIQLDAIGDARNEWYVIAFRSEDASSTQYRDARMVYAPGTDKTGDYRMLMSGEADVQQRVAIDDRTDGKWPPRNVTIRAERISGEETTTRARLGSSNLGTMWLNDSTSYRIFAERDDGAERRIGMLTAVSEDSDHPAIFSIYPADEAWNDSDMSNRTNGSVDSWDNETDIHYPPTASISADNRSPVAGEIVEFDASGSSTYDGSAIESYEWTLPDGSTASGSTASWDSSGSAGETATVSVTVTDSEGYQDTSQVTLYVAEDAADAAVPPTADATLETDDPMVGESVVLAEAAETADGVALESVEWDVDGDGEFEEAGEKLEYQPDQSGLETVTIRVTDANGVSASRSISFFVGSDANSGLGFGGGGGGGGGIGGGPIGGGGGPSGSQQIALGVAGVGAYALWRRSGGPGVVALAGSAAPAVKRAGTSALSAVGTLARGIGRALRKLVGALT